MQMLNLQSTRVIWSNLAHMSDTWTESQVIVHTGGLYVNWEMMIIDNTKRLFNVIILKKYSCSMHWSNRYNATPGGCTLYFPGIGGGFEVQLHHLPAKSSEPVQAPGYCAFIKIIQVAWPLVMWYQLFLELFSDMNSGKCPVNWVRTFAGVHICWTQQEIVGAIWGHRTSGTFPKKFRWGVERQLARRGSFPDIFLLYFHMGTLRTFYKGASRKRSWKCPGATFQIFAFSRTQCMSDKEDLKKGYWPVGWPATSIYIVTVAQWKLIATQYCHSILSF